MRCRYCQKESPDGRAYCIYCGAELKQDRKKAFNYVPVLVGMGAAAVLLGIIIVILLVKSGKQEEPVGEAGTETGVLSTAEGTAGVERSTETEGAGITGDLYTDARNGMLYMSISDGVIVDFDGNVLDQYSGITCLENGALITENGEIIENLFVGTKEQIYYALSGAVESGAVVEVELIIINKTGTDICSFYASAAGTDRWGENLLEGNELCAEDNTSVRCKIGKDTLRWNFAFEDVSGNREEIYDLDLSSCREDFIHLELWRDDDGSAYVELY